MQEGGDTTPAEPKKKSIRDISLDRVTDPKVPTGATVSPYAVPTDDPEQTISTTSGQVDTTAPQATVTTADTASATLNQPPAEDTETFR